MFQRESRLTISDKFEILQGGHLSLWSNKISKCYEGKETIYSLSQVNSILRWKWETHRRCRVTWAKSCLYPIITRKRKIGIPKAQAFFINVWFSTRESFPSFQYKPYDHAHISNHLWAEGLLVQRQNRLGVSSNSA